MAGIIRTRSQTYAAAKRMKSLPETDPTDCKFECVLRAHTTTRGIASVFLSSMLSSLLDPVSIARSHMASKTAAEELEHIGYRAITNTINGFATPENRGYFVDELEGKHMMVSRPYKITLYRPIVSGVDWRTVTLVGYIEYTEAPPEDKPLMRVCDGMWFSFEAGRALKPLWAPGGLRKITVQTVADIFVVAGSVLSTIA